MHVYRRRQGRDALRWATAQPELAARLAERLDSVDLPPDVLSRQEVQEQLLLALTELDSEDQELLIGFYFDGRTQAALAGVLGISERAIEGRLYRARRALRDRLAHLEPEENGHDPAR